MKEGDLFNQPIHNKYTGSNPDKGEAWRKEKFVRNLQINFGPQHPAAHGVLRSVRSEIDSDLDNENSEDPKELSRF